MKPERLILAHWPREVPWAVPPAPAPGMLWLQTCQRQLLVTSACRWRRWADPWKQQVPELLHGREAYRRLLEIGAGLHSDVPGETNVFGQFRDALASCRDSVLNESGLLAWLERATADIRRVRREHLQGIGGDAWGSLVRQALKPLADQRILIVGAGNLARSLVPWLGTAETGILNRSEINDVSLWKINRYFHYSQSEEAVRWAHALVMTTPPDTDHDARWSALAHHYRPSRVLHLGRVSASTGPWDGLDHCLFLDHLTGLGRQRSDLRRQMLDRASEACGVLAQRATAQGRSTVGLSGPPVHAYPRFSRAS